MVVGCAGAPTPEDDGADFAERMEGYRPCKPRGNDRRGGFCEASQRWGLHLTFDENTGENEPAAGVLSAADFDGDGRVDLVVGFDAMRPMALLLNREGAFVDVGSLWGLDQQRRISSTATADLDGDGDPDLLVYSRDGRGVRLLRNDRGRFVLVGHLDGGEDVNAISLSDLDADGLLDVVVASAAREGDCRLPFISGCPEGVLAWRQRARWEFESVPVRAEPRRALALRWHDLDADGRDELIVGSDFGMLNGGNQVLRVERVGGALTLTEQPLPPGFDARIFAMGVSPIDVDGDGVDEVLVTNYGCNVLMHRVESHWVDMARAWGADAYGVPLAGQEPHFNPLDPDNRWMGPMAGFRDRYLEPGSTRMPSTKWTPLVFDYDQDGRDDVYIGTGMTGISTLFPEPTLQAGVMLHGTGHRLDDVTDALRLAELHGGHFPVAADFDGDGDLDLAMVHGALPGRPGRMVALRNDASVGNALTVTARGRGGARDGIGAHVRARVGDRVVERRLDGTLSIAGAAPHVVHLGLGSAAVVDELEVRFVSGAVRRLHRVPAGSVVVAE